MKLPLIPECPGCKERQEKIIEAAKAFAEWVKNPRGVPPVLPGIMPGTPPQQTNKKNKDT